MRRIFNYAAAVLVAGIIATGAGAHEFWIEGTFDTRDGDKILALDLKVGQKLDGVSLPYIPKQLDRFEWVQGGVGPIAGRTGDLPAARVAAPASGPAIIFHRTQPRKLVHKDWNKFQTYLADEGLAGVEERHVQRGLPKTGFTETYTRHAKFIWATQSGRTVKDKFQGSSLEFVLEAVSVLNGNTSLEGRLLSSQDSSDMQISVYYCSPTGLEIRRHSAQTDGSFKLDLPGHGPVLLNAVMMTDPLSDGVAWHSDWASVFVKMGLDAFHEPDAPGMNAHCNP